MDKKIFDDWFKRWYPDGKVDWKAEFFRLAIVTKQAIESGLLEGEKTAAVSLFSEIAIPTAKYLMDREDDLIHQNVDKILNGTN